MKIGYRTIKTAVGAGVALWIAQLLHLDFYATAATITILCIGKTRKQSVKTALHRFTTCMLTLPLGALLYEILGYTPWVFALIILTVLPILNRFKLQDSFMTGMVVPIHLLSLGKVSGTIIAEEVIVILIGICIAMLVNSHMPNQEKELIAMKFQIENHFRRVLTEFALFLDKGDQAWDKKALDELPELIKEAKELSLVVSGNHLIKDKEGYFFYFDVRDKQCEILERMYDIIVHLSADNQQRHMFADFLLHVGDNLSGRNDTHLSLQKLKGEKEKMLSLPLPHTQEELKTRDAIIHLMYETELFLLTKLNMYQEQAEHLEKIHQ